MMNYHPRPWGENGAAMGPAAEPAPDPQPLDLDDALAALEYMLADVEGYGQVSPATLRRLVLAAHDLVDSLNATKRVTP